MRRIFFCLFVKKKGSTWEDGRNKNGEKHGNNTCVVLVCIWNICGFIFFGNRSVFFDTLLAIGFHPSAFSVKTEMVSQ